MGILHIVQYSLPQITSGYTLRTQAVLHHQRALGLDPTVVTSPRHPSSIDEEVEGIHHYRCPLERPGRSVWFRDRARVQVLAARIEEIVKSRGDFDLLHAHSPVLCGISALRAGRRLGIPVVYEVRGLWEEALRRGRPSLSVELRYRLARLMETRVCRAVDAVVVISDGLRKEFVGRGVVSSRIHVVGNGTDTYSLRPRSVSSDWRLSTNFPESPVILYLGALRDYEGVNLLLEAFPAIRSRHPSVQLVIIGSGEAREKLAAALDGTRSPIHLLPAVPPHEVPAYYAAADLVVYPRLADRETECVTPLKPLEAMAMGKAIVASDVGGLRELLEDGRSARLFTAGSSRALAEACISLLADEGERHRLGGNAREIAEFRFDWSRVVPLYCGVYDPLLGKR